MLYNMEKKDITRYINKLKKSLRHDISNKTQK